MKLASLVSIVLCGLLVEIAISQEAQTTQSRQEILMSADSFDATVSFTLPEGYKSKESKPDQMVWRTEMEQGDDGKYKGWPDTFQLDILETKMSLLKDHHRKFFAEQRTMIVELIVDKELEDGSWQFAYIAKGGYYRCTLVLEKFYPLKNGVALLTYRKILGPMSDPKIKMAIKSVGEDQDVQRTFKSFKEVETASREPPVTSVLLADPPELDASKMWRSAAKLAFHDTQTGVDTVIFFDFRTRDSFAAIVPHDEATFSWAPINGPMPRVDLYVVQSELVSRVRNGGKSSRVESDIQLVKLFAEQQKWSSDYQRLASANEKLCHMRSKEDHRDVITVHPTMNETVLLVINYATVEDDRQNAIVQEVLSTFLFGLGS